MSHKNKVELEGRLERITPRTTTTGKQVTEMRVATDREWNGGHTTDYHTVVAWEKLAEQCKDFQEGDTVAVEGRLQTRSWEDEEGKKQYRTEVIASTIRLVEEEVEIEES